MFAQSLLEYMGLTPTLAATIDAGGTVTPMHMVLNAIAGHRAGLRGGGALHLRRERAHRPAQGGALAAAGPLARPGGVRGALRLHRHGDPVRAGRPAPHAPPRHHQGAARRGRGVSPPARRAQPACPDAEAPDHGRLPGRAPHRRSVRPARLLGDVGRRGRTGAHHRGARARSGHHAGARAGLRGQGDPQEREPDARPRRARPAPGRRDGPRPRRPSRSPTPTSAASTTRSPISTILGVEALGLCARRRGRRLRGRGPARPGRPVPGESRMAASSRTPTSAA